MRNAAYNLVTGKTWSETLDDLEETFRKWNVTEWWTEPQRPPRKRWYTTDERSVTLTFGRGAQTIRIAHDRQDRPEDNVRVLYLAAEAMRLNDKRGISDVLASAYAQLPGPSPASPAAARVASPSDLNNAYAALFLAPDAPLPVAEAAYRALAREYHPDTGADGAAFRRIAAAIEAIRSAHE